MDPLETLELKPGSTKEDAKRNFRRLSFLYHPDKHPNDKTAEENFKRIVNAYEQIKKNPLLLSKKETNFTISDNILYMDLNVTVEDLYFEKAKQIYLKKTIPCSTCSGTGTKDVEHGICELCRGTGKIESKILGFLKKERVCFCPKCGGLGVKKDFACDSCKGIKTAKLFKAHTINLNLRDYNNKFLIIKGEGHCYPDSPPGDVFIKLNVKEDPVYKIENGCLCIEYGITPTQSFIGDICDITIFGKKFSFKVPVASNAIVLSDKRKEFSKEKKIIIQTSLLKPVLNDNTIELYRKILQIEKVTKSA